MRMRTVALIVAGLTLSAPAAWAAPCATACKDEIKACMSQECQGLKPAARMRCKRVKCRKPLLNDCYLNLSVCGATRAHPGPTPGSGQPHPVAGGW